MVCIVVSVAPTLFPGCWQLCMHMTRKLRVGVSGWGGRRSAHHPKADRVRVRVSAFRVVSESTGIFVTLFSVPLEFSLSSQGIIVR